VPAGGSVQERVTVPYITGKGISTSMEVTYDDVLGTQQAAYARYLARKSNRLFYERRGVRRAEDVAAEDSVFYQTTSGLMPYRPKLECFVAAQNVDADGNNIVTICLRNNSKRRIDRNFFLMAGLKDDPHDYAFHKVEYTNYNNIPWRVIHSHDRIAIEGKRYSSSYYLDDYGSYEACYFTVKVPEVTERTELYASATLYYMDGTEIKYLTYADSKSLTDYGLVTLVPTSQTTGLEKVYENGTPDCRLHVDRKGSSLVVSGARQQAGADGTATFRAPTGSGVVLISDGKETVKYRY